MKTNPLFHGGAKVCVSMLSVLFLGLFGVLLTRSLYSQQLDPGKLRISPTVTKVSQIYTSQIGIREKQPNSGLAVEQYLRYVNLKKGNPWCAAFVCWVYGKAGVENPRTGWSPSLFPAGKVIWNREPGTRNVIASGAWQKESRLPANVPVVFGSGLATRNTPTGQAGSPLKTPETGDIFGIYFPEKGRIAHAGFIDKWDGTWIVTVEGNTNVLGGREGDGVYRKRRLVRSIYKVARYINYK